MIHSLKVNIFKLISEILLLIVTIIITIFACEFDFISILVFKILGWFVSYSLVVIIAFEILAWILNKNKKSKKKKPKFLQKLAIDTEAINEEFDMGGEHGKKKDLT